MKENKEIIFDDCGYFPNTTEISEFLENGVPSLCNKTCLILLLNDILIYVKFEPLPMGTDKYPFPTYQGKVFNIGDDDKIKEYKNIKINDIVFFKRNNISAYCLLPENQ